MLFETFSLIFSHERDIEELVLLKIKTFDMSVSATKTVTTKLNYVGSKTVPSGAVVSSLGIDNFALWSLYSLTVNHVLLELDQEGNLKPRKDSTFLNSIL